MVQIYHRLDLLGRELVKLLLVARGLERQPDVSAKRNQSRLKLTLAFVSIVVPCQGDIREPNQEGQDPEILVGREPITGCKNRCEDDALDVKGERVSGKKTTGHLYRLT